MWLWSIWMTRLILLRNISLMTGEVGDPSNDSRGQGWDGQLCREAFCRECSPASAAQDRWPLALRPHLDSPLCQGRRRSDYSANLIGGEGDSEGASAGVGVHRLRLERRESLRDKHIHVHLRVCVSVWNPLGHHQNHFRKENVYIRHSKGKCAAMTGLV